MTKGGPYWWIPNHVSNKKPTNIDELIATVESWKEHDEATLEHCGHDEYYVGKTRAYKDCLLLLNSLKQGS